MKNEQYFDSNDWKTIKETLKKIKAEIGRFWVGKTTNGETITFHVLRPNTLVTTVYQHDGWIRENTYNCDDYTTTETYEKARE